MREEAESLKQESQQLHSQQAEFDKLRSQLKKAEKERDGLAELTNALTLELSSLRESQSQSQQIPDLEGTRDRVLFELKLGKQAPGYKAAVKALDRYIDELRSQ